MISASYLLIRPFPRTFGSEVDQGKNWVHYVQETGPVES